MRHTMLALAAVLLFCRLLPAQERPPAFIPAKEPIIACFIPQLDIAERIAGSQLIAAARLSDRDLPLRLPGLGKIPSIRTFLDRLSLKQAEDFWLCFPDLTRAAMGWTLPSQGAALEAVEMFLDQSGIDSQKVHIQIDETDDKQLRILVASSPATLKSLMSDKEANSSPGTRHSWRESFREIMTLDDGVGLWLNSRQLSGMLAMFTGVDIRPVFRSADIDFPFAVSARLEENNNEVGLYLAVHGKFDELSPSGKQAESVIFYGYQQEPPIRLDMHLNSPESLLPVMERIPPLPGVDFTKFIPTDASLGIWSDSFGNLSASLSAAFRPGVRATEDFVRLGSFLTTFFSSPDSAVKVEAMPEAPWIKFVSADATLSLLLAPDTKGRDVLYVLIGDYTDMANSLDVRNDIKPEGSSVNWRIALDPDMRKTATDILSGKATKLLPFNPGVAFWAVVTGMQEVGIFGLDVDRIYFDSPQGGALWLGLGAWAEVESRVGEFSGNRQSALAVERLRFFLDAACQSRYRQVTAKNRRAAALPGSLSQIAFAGSDGKAWLDNSLPGFPGLGKPNYGPLQRAADGAVMGGYVYAIEATAGNWGITATPKSSSLPLLRIDAAGKIMERNAVGVWQSRQTVLADFF